MTWLIVDAGDAVQTQKWVLNVKEQCSVKYPSEFVAIFGEFFQHNYVRTPINQSSNLISQRDLATAFWIPRMNKLLLCSQATYIRGVRYGGWYSHKPHREAGLWILCCSVCMHSLHPAHYNFQCGTASRILHHMHLEQQNGLSYCWLEPF